MYITNVTDYDNLALCNFTKNDNNDIIIEIIIPFFTIIPCSLSLICLITLMVYKLVKPLLRKKYIYVYILINENGGNFIPKSSS